MTVIFHIQYKRLPLSTYSFDASEKLVHVRKLKQDEIFGFYLNQQLNNVFAETIHKWIWTFINGLEVEKKVEQWLILKHLFKALLEGSILWNVCEWFCEMDWKPIWGKFSCLVSSGNRIDPLWLG